MINPDPIVLEILKKRNITGEDEINEFLSPSPKRTYDPFLMHDMEEGVETLIRYAEEGKKICVFGDYDADGITSTAMMIQTLRRITENVFFYIPSRFDEGYGLNREAIDKIHDEGTELIITVDCGSVSFDEVSYAQELGIEVIVTDHHMVSDKEHNCCHINPNQDSCDYPFSGLSGCGVAFKICCGLIQRAGIEKDAKKDILDLCAIGTIGDVVPLVDENRTLVKYGLKAIRDGRRKSLSSLMEALGIERNKADEGDMAYGIIPHLNAAGRMGDADIAVRFLLCEDESEINGYVQEIIRRNSERKILQNRTFDRCLGIIDKQETDHDRCIVVRYDDAHEGIIGIVAGKIKDRFNKPAIILSKTADGLKGTGRSVPGINLHELLKKSESLFSKFGGHAGACGFTLDEDNFEEFCKSIKNYSEEYEAEEIKEDEEADCIINISDISTRFIRDINLLSPFGKDNEMPVFEIRDVKLLNLAYMGSSGDHARFVLENGNDRIKCVLFNKAQEYRDILKDGMTVTVDGTVKLSEWKNHIYPQLMVQTVRG